MSTEPNWEKAFLGMNIYFDCFLELFKKIEKRKDVPEEVKKMMDKELEKANNKWNKFMGFRKTGMVGDWERWEFDQKKCMFCGGTGKMQDGSECPH